MSSWMDRLGVLYLLAFTAGCTPIAEPSIAPPAFGECQRAGTHCYTPGQVLAAYGLDKLHARGVDGRGTTIAIVVPGMHPYAQKVLDKFSDDAGLPRTQIEVINRGVKPPSSRDEGGLAAAHEAILDLQVAHMVAPAARLVYVQTGFSRMFGIGNAVEEIGRLTRSRKIDVVSISWGASEPTVVQAAGGRARFDQLRQPLIQAHLSGTTLLAASGDYGAGGHHIAASAPSEPAVAWPASDPLVTAVGGVQVELDAQGQRTGPDTVWGSSTWPSHADRGTGAGVSSLFDRPAHQDHAAIPLGPHRGVPDVAAVAADESPVKIYATKNGKPYLTVAHGTSTAAPLLAGVVALAAQQAGGPLGNVAPTLHRYVERPGDAGLYDLVDGCNHTADHKGYCARPGYDVVSGVGAVDDASRLVKALASQAGR